MKALYPLLVLVLLTGCHAYRTPVPDGCCLVTFTHRGAFGRTETTEFIGQRLGNVVTVKGCEIPYYQVLFAIAKEPGGWAAFLDYEKATMKNGYKVIPVWRECRR